MNGVCPCCGAQTEDGTDLLISLDANAASRLGITIRLQPQEAEILTILHSRRPQIVNRTRLLMMVYGVTGGPERDTLHVQLSKLRRKIAPLGVVIANTPRTGWRLEYHDAPIAEPMQRQKRYARTETIEGRISGQKVSR